MDNKVERFTQFLYSNENKYKKVILGYLYSAISTISDNLNKNSKILIPAICKYFKIADKFQFVDIDDLNELVFFLRNNGYNGANGNIFILVDALDSNNLMKVANFLSKQYEYKNIFQINASSTINIPILNQNNIMRLSIIDGVNANIFKIKLEENNPNNIVFLIDENDLWAVYLANDIERILDYNVTRYNIRDNNITLPSGTMSILALANIEVQDLMNILQNRVNDINIITIGDITAGLRANNEEELNFLIQTNTTLIIPKYSTYNDYFFELFTSLTGLNNISLITDITISAVQISVYLKNCIKRSKKSYKDQYFIMGNQLDIKTLDRLVGNFSISKFTQVNEPARNITNVVISIYDNDEIKLYYSN